MFRIGEEVLYLDDNDQWVTAKICSIDSNDDDQPYGIDLSSGEICWPDPERLKKKIRLTSQGHCPLCGSRGALMFTSFQCTNSSCQNYD